jgi:phosphate transport system substrate-binding protein
MRSRTLLSVLLLSLLGPVMAPAQGTVLAVRGDTSMKPFLEPLLAAFGRAHPEIVLKVDMGHSPPENRSALGDDVAELFQRNDEDFYRKHGYAPLNVPVSSGGRHAIGTIQALGVFVHPSNPVKWLTLEQVEAIFSAQPRGGRPPITKWGQLGLTGEWAERPIVAYGRERKQGASNYFRMRALGGADYSRLYQECANSTKVIEAVAADPAGIGYSALAYNTPQVRALPLAEREAAVVGRPTEEDVAALRYPLAYPLFFSINRKPGQALDPAIKLFLRFALGAEGQKIIASNGYLPLPVEVAEYELQKLE